MVNLWILVVACFVKKDDPELLIPPADYEVEVLDKGGFSLCIDAHPETAKVMVSSRPVVDCVQVKGEVFVEVSQKGFAPYRELLMVQSDLTHQVLLVPILPQPSIPEVSIPNVEVPRAEGPKMGYPMPTQQQSPAAFQPSQSVQLCVTSEPADAYLRINGMKRKSGACISVQNAAEVIVEADGYSPYTELLSIPPKQKEPLQHHVTLERSRKEVREEY